MYHAAYNPNDVADVTPGIKRLDAPSLHRCVDSLNGKLICVLAAVSDIFS